jgi:uncharacterized iron-regulated membrane protein
MFAASPEIAEASPDSKPVAYEKLLASAQTAIPNWKQFEIRMTGGDRGRDSGKEAKNWSSSKAVGIAFKERGQSPSFSTGQLWLDPFTGAVLRRDSFADLTLGRRVRLWIRFLHTGEAFGLVGKVVAAAASLGGAVLVWTGLSLAFRRMLGNVGGAKASPATAGAALKA